MRASDRAYETLRAEIVDGSLPPETVLAEVELSTRLGVSRTPIRTALGRLVADGLAAPHSGRGLVVTAVTTDHITELFEVREALEMQAARLAAQRRDVAVFIQLHEEFSHAHELLDETTENRVRYYALVDRLDAAVDQACANSFLVASLQGVRTHIARLRRLAHDNPIRLKAAAAEHLAIVDAIVDGADGIAASATQLHIHNSLKNILATAERSAGADGAGLKGEQS